MFNKVLIGILVFLVIVNGGVGAYSYSISQQIDTLSEQLASFQEEQETRVAAVSDEFTALRGETLTRIDKLDSDITMMADELSQSVINANEVYYIASQATVKVSDGERTIGSGFIFDTETHVVTAEHVVEHLSEIYVVLPDGRISRATVAGSCQYSDIAVLTLEDGLDIKPPTLVDSVTVRIGEPVAVVGYPFNLTQTLTSGIVSQINRSAEIEYDLQTRWIANLIQFDAAVNFGNSGSPLLNSKGEVIGMVIGRVKPEEGDGIYYATSSNKVKRVASSLISQGSFNYPWLGVEVANLTPEMVRIRGLETTHGAVTRRVFTGSPAEVAGIRVDDIIVAIDGVTVSDVSELVSYLGEYRSPDELVLITLIRDSRIQELSLKVGKRGS